MAVSFRLETLERNQVMTECYSCGSTIGVDYVCDVCFIELCCDCHDAYFGMCDGCYDDEFDVEDYE